jgi:hypothetical protein
MFLLQRLAFEEAAPKVTRAGYDEAWDQVRERRDRRSVHFATKVKPENAGAGAQLLRGG